MNQKNALENIPVNLREPRGSLPEINNNHQNTMNIMRAKQKPVQFHMPNIGSAISDPLIFEPMKSISPHEKNDLKLPALNSLESDSSNTYIENLISKQLNEKLGGVNFMERISS